MGVLCSFLLQFPEFSHGSFNIHFIPPSDTSLRGVTMEP